jgi:hypothetical protein
MIELGSDDGIITSDEGAIADEDGTTREIGRTSDCESTGAKDGTTTDD